MPGREVGDAPRPRPFSFDLAGAGDHCVFVRAAGTAIPVRPDATLLDPTTLGDGCP